MTKYKHPPAFKVIKADPRLGPYHHGATFNAEELTHDEGERYIDEGVLEAIDAFGDPIVHVPDAEPFAEPVEDEAPAPKKPAAKAKK